MNANATVRKFVLFLIRQRLIFLTLALLICGVGWWAVVRIPRDSFPDITPVRVEVDTQVPGLASEEVEKLVTDPIEQALRGIPKSLTIRSESKFSLSVVEVQFDPGTDLYWARAQVFQSLSNASLPSGVTPQVAPMDEGAGQIFIYTLVSKKLDNMQLRTLQDFLVKRMLTVVPGVADVPMFGGFVKQYQVIVDPGKLSAANLGLADVESALQNNNSSVGGNYIRRGSTQYVIRGIGLVRTLDDIRNTVISTNNGVPVTIGDVAAVRIGPEDRQGAVSVNGQGEVVAGIVIKRIGENTAAVIERVKLKLEEIQKILASGKYAGLDTSDVKVVTLYDQSYLIKQATDTVTTSLGIGALLVVAILLLFTGSLRASIIPIFATGFCILTAFFLMKQYDVSANLLSLGGLALSLGMMVDATVMITENVFRHVVEEEHPGWTHEEIVAEGVAEILKPTVLAVLVIVAVFGPVLVLKGIEGQLFIPLALAVVFSMVGSLVFAILITPGLCYWLIRGSHGGHTGPNVVMRALHRLYRGPLLASVRHPWTVAIVCLIVMGLSVVTFRYTGSEFLPPLEEGNFRIRFTFPPSVSLPYMMAEAANGMKHVATS